MATVAGTQTNRYAGASARRRVSLESEAFSAFPY
ncbi:MAG: hypothetical protein JWN10_1222, partial [Solirubrobacterales bacterium]|nr:hypothetical protein [Solirubrobacterales bacterium]